MVILYIFMYDKQKNSAFFAYKNMLKLPFEG